MNAVKYVAAAVLLAAVASGCASYPVSKEYREHARQITIAQVRADPEGTRGALVIWGGRIINVVNESSGSSIYVYCLPLPEDGKPMVYAASPGRFIATSPGFLDPGAFPAGGLITVAGQLDGVRAERVGTMPYTYPVLNIEDTHVWPPESQDYYSSDYGYYGPSWAWNWWWGPYWWWGWWGGYYPYYHGYHGGFHGYYGGHHGGGYYYGGGGGYHGYSGGGYHGGGGGGGGGHGGGGGGGGGHGR